jgi:hypothetical protein
MPHSTTARKPRKPHADFPPFPRATGQWAEEIRQRLHYFGKWANDPKRRGRPESVSRPKGRPFSGLHPTPEVVAVADLCNHFLASKRHLTQTGEISTLTFADDFTSPPPNGAGQG